MTTVLAIILPIFGLIALGVIGGRSRLFPESAVNGLNNFVLYVAVPALLFRTIVRGNPLDALNLERLHLCERLEGRAPALRRRHALVGRLEPRHEGEVLGGIRLAAAL